MPNCPMPVKSAKYELSVKLSAAAMTESRNLVRGHLAAEGTESQHWRRRGRWGMGRCGLSANLECRSEMCSARLAANTGCKKSPSGHNLTTLSGYIFATKARIDNRKKLLSSNMFCTCPHNMVWAHYRLRSIGEFGAPLQISVGFACWQRYCTTFQYWAYPLRSWLRSLGSIIRSTSGVWGRAPGWNSVL